MTDDREPENLTLWDAITDLGWFALFSSVIVGGSSVLAVLEEVFVNHRLISFFQWILDAYARVTTVLGALVEPSLQPVIAWIGDVFRLELVLDPVWRPLFILGMMIVIGTARSYWNAGMRGLAVLLFVSQGLGVLVGALASGVVPASGAWFAQGIAAGVPLACLFLGLGIAVSVRDVLRRDVKGGVNVLVRVGRIALAFAVGGFGLGAALSVVVPNGAGIAALALLVVGFGLLRLQRALADADRLGAQMALTILGGFLTATLVVAADLGVKALS